MRRLERLFTALLAAVTFSVLAGCYSFSGSGLPTGMKTVRIEQVVDKALQPELADQASRAVVRGFQSNGALRPVDGEADALLETSLAGYSHGPQQYDQAGTVTRFRVTVTFAAKFIDQRDQAILFESSSISGYRDYDPNIETEIEARDKALKEAVKKLIDNTISGW